MICEIGTKVKVYNRMTSEIFTGTIQSIVRTDEEITAVLVDICKEDDSIRLAYFDIEHWEVEHA